MSRRKNRRSNPPTANPAPRETSAFEAGLADLVNTLNNRLAAMIGFAGLLERRSLAPADREAADRAMAEGLKAADVVRDIVRLIRQPSDRQQSTSLHTAIETALRRLRQELGAQHIDVKLEVDPDVSLVVGQRGDVVDLFVRLLRFAVVRLQHAPLPRTVSLTARAYGAGVVVHQVDSGPPLPASPTAIDLDYFGPVDPGIPGHAELSLARRVAENCSAGLQLAAGAAGGAAVAVTFIPGHLVAGPLPRLRGGAVPVARARVLVADDDRANREALAQLLGRAGHQVTLAADGEQALDRLASERFDAVIVDLNMPRVSGRALYERTMTTAPDQAGRFVFVTGDDARAVSQEFLQHVPQPLLFKPYVFADLLVAIDEVSSPHPHPHPHPSPRPPTPPPPGRGTTA